MNFKSESSSPEEIKKREYLKQQHQLRTMTKSAAPLSADNMIESLLSRKEIFQKKTNQTSDISVQKPQIGPWPVWLTPGREPSTYKDIWKLVGTPNGLADTNKLSLLLMTSRLTTETLGYIWSLSNVTVPGSLTQQELYVALALVALAQSGYTFANSNVVRQLKEAPQPILDLHHFGSQLMIPPVVTSPAGASPLTVTPSPLLPSPGSSSELHPVPPPVPTITENISLLDISHEPLSLIDSSPTKSLAVLSAMDLRKDCPEVKSLDQNLVFSDFQTGLPTDDEFDDFKSADIFCTDMNTLTVLDVNETKVLSKTDPPALDVAVDDLFPRCSVKSKSPDLLPSPVTAPYESKPLQDIGVLSDLPVLDPKNSGRISKEPPLPVFTSKEVSFEKSAELSFDIDLGRIESSLEVLKVEESLRSREPHSLELNPINTSVSTIQPSSLPSMSKPPTESPKPSLVPSNASALQEDKYSALRLLDSGLFSSEDSGARPPEEFGDFLTADVPHSTGPTQTLKEADDDIQNKCLEACLKLLREAVLIFENIEDTKVLNQIASHERGKAYLQEVLEVERIGRRIRSTRETCDLISEFENLSKILQPYIEYVKNNHMEEQDGPKCGICLCEHGPAHVKYGINHFHAPCANLYLHMVDPILPIAPVM